jgi:hypothetical protein
LARRLSPSQDTAKKNSPLIEALNHSIRSFRQFEEREDVAKFIEELGFVA